MILEGIGYQRGKRERVKDEKKEEEYLITYTRDLEKKVRNLETENLTLEHQIKQLRLEKQVKLKHDLDSLHNEIDKYKKMGIWLVDDDEREEKKGRNKRRRIYNHLYKAFRKKAKNFRGCKFKIKAGIKQLTKWER